MLQEKGERVASTHESVIVSEVHDQSPVSVLSTEPAVQQQTKAIRKVSIKQGVGIDEPVVQGEASEFTKASPQMVKKYCTPTTLSTFN